MPLYEYILSKASVLKNRNFS